MRTFAPLTPALLSGLAAIVGPEHVRTDAATRELYGHDETEDLLYPPEVVVKPANTAEVAKVLALAYAAGVPAARCRSSAASCSRSSAWTKSWSSTSTTTWPSCSPA